ncbi:MAG: NAD(P)/FAD-dependent oxidoreductase [Selenomonadales bacterium]|nr:NAD(P)/FAD-dependent oxidoreductase [Selenomonadales bacterium]
MNTLYDLAIIGGGPAGLSAALTARIRGKRVALFEHLDFSRKLQRAHDVDNYLGMPHRTGESLMREMADHALAHEPDLIREKVISVFAGKTFTIACKENLYNARAVILATGTSSSKPFEGEQTFLGKGVSYCATCDGMFFRGKNVAVIAYGKEGESDAAYLADLCKEVHYLPLYRGGDLRADNVTICREVPRRIEGDKKAERLITDQSALSVDGIFIIRESDPVESLVRGIAMDGTHIAVDRQMRTSIDGLYACGDCTGKPYQVAKAVGEGLIAALSAVEYLHEQASKAEA